MSEASTPGVRVIPPLVYLVGLALGYALEHFWPLLDVPVSWMLGIATVLICLSAAMVVPAIGRFRRVGTPFDVRKPATSLVTDGPYARSRNPGYLALSTFYVAIGLLLGSVWTLVLLLPVLMVIRYAVVAREEAHLERVFGQEYREYKSRVPRWI